jgi:O-antigen/teichoic acid export membrane protein
VGNALPVPARHAAGMARGTVIVQLAMLLAIPLLARLYDTEAFGIFGIFSTATTALGAAAAWRFDKA